MFDNTIVAALAVVLIVAGAIDISSKPEQKKYSDQYMSFIFPGDYFSVPTSYSGLTIVEIKNDEKKFADVARIELAQENTDSLEDILKSSYSDFSKKQVKKIYKTSSGGYQFTQTTVNESVIYTYFKEKNSVFMIKFYEGYYDNNNAIIRINNSLLLKDFYQLVNSFDIK